VTPAEPKASNVELIDEPLTVKQPRKLPVSMRLLCGPVRAAAPTPANRNANPTDTTTDTSIAPWFSISAPPPPLKTRGQHEH
jgi:hypothetical protein